MPICRVKVITRAKKNEIVERGSDFIKVKIKAAPEKGKANQELIRFLAEELGVSRDAVQILTGHSGRRKTISINI
ncbi:MAG: hypothetical protein A2295_04365 [Candidatus Jacksonbacteria bacterium RIFOXYB2_FULL_44_15]|nr:MAG: hypothetical protein A2295_04365 [Candidatus Jacksonbacteria bacterium RIFOXYB2_FULL_44_15]OGY78571.1 MAG: hypothetical protein A2550_03875 [Candidatus Jacksonbacteria bacterium RIFOXYD2_FULL_43_21]